VTSPTVTIAIPAFNAGAYIERCVTSALAGSEERVEVILLDDASTDDTVERARSIDDARLTVVTHDRNIGRAANVKRALESGTAAYVALLPADCALPTSSVEVRAEALERHPAATFAFGAVDLCDADDVTIGNRSFGSRAEVLSGLESPGPLLPSNRVFLSACLLRRSAYREVGGLVLDVAPTHRDWDLLLRLGLVGPVAYVPETVAVERVHEGNITTQLEREDRIVTAELLILEAIQRWALQHAPDATPLLQDAVRQWSHRRIAHALLAVGGFTSSDPSRALGCALALNPALRHSARYYAALVATALPRALVRPLLRPALAPFDRRRRQRWNLPS
jgi:alpha-1,6-rhamnosyltransferase